jgi:hypothetical protein
MTRSTSSEGASLEADSLPVMLESRSYPTERERAVQAALLGALLGALLALLARTRRS